MNTLTTRVVCAFTLVCAIYISIVLSTGAQSESVDELLNQHPSRALEYLMRIGEGAPLLTNKQAIQQFNDSSLVVVSILGEAHYEAISRSKVLTNINDMLIDTTYGFVHSEILSLRNTVRQGRAMPALNGLLESRVQTVTEMFPMVRPVNTSERFGMANILADAAWMNPHLVSNALIRALDKRPLDDNNDPRKMVLEVMRGAALPAQEKSNAPVDREAFLLYYSIGYKLGRTMPEVPTSKEKE